MRNLEKLIVYIASAIIVVSFNLCLGPLPRTKISSFLISICMDELLPNPKITLSHQSKSEKEKSEQEWNPVSYSK